MITKIIFFLVAFQIKHFLADFLFKNIYIPNNIKTLTWEKPLFAHVLVHGIGTFLISFWFGAFNAILFSLFDISTHFVIDHLKSDIRYFGRFKYLDDDTYILATDKQRKESKYYWWIYGADQALHHLTGIVITYWLIN
jgi:hypothetical protein